MRYILALFLFVNTAVAAPVPKTVPKVFGKTDILGTWEYTWGGMKGGEIIFFEDGSYYARHNLKSPNFFMGQWYIDSYSQEYCFREAWINIEMNTMNSYGTMYHMKIKSNEMPLEWSSQNGPNGFTLVFERRRGDHK